MRSVPFGQTGLMPLSGLRCTGRDLPALCFPMFFMDMLPHGDYLAYYGGFLIPDSLWLLREFLAAMFVLLLVVVVLRGRSRLIALAAGIGGALLDLDNLAIGMGWIKRSQAISPSHSGVWPHGQNIGLPSFVFEIGFVFACVGGGWRLVSWRERPQAVRARRVRSGAVG